MPVRPAPRKWYYGLQAGKRLAIIDAGAALGPPPPRGKLGTSPSATFSPYIIGYRFAVRHVYGAVIPSRWQLPASVGGLFCSLSQSPMHAGAGTLGYENWSAG